MTDYSIYSTRQKPRWGRIVALWAILIALMVTMFSCQAAHADQLPVPVQTIIGECANCSDDGMIAVGNVIRNRAVRRGQTVEEVCLAKWQFSFWNDRRRAEKFLKENKGVVDRAMTAWQVSATEDITKGGDHYHADYIAIPKWAKSMRQTTKVGNHVFYASK